MLPRLLRKACSIIKRSSGASAPSAGPPATPEAPVADTTLGPDKIALRMPAVFDLTFAGYRAYRRLVGETTFQPLTDEATDLTEVTGAYPLDVDADGLASLAAETGCTTTVADVSDESYVERIFAEAEAAFGTVNVLVNNAGILRDGLLVKKDRETGAIKSLSTEKWDKVIAVNLAGQTASDASFVDFVRHQFQRTGIDPAWLSFEVTETAAVSDLNSSA